MILWEFAHNSLVLLSPQIRFYLRFCGNFYIIAQRYSHHRSGFIYVFMGIFTQQISITLKAYTFLSMFLYVLWEALHYRSASLSIHISFYLCFVGSFTLQISVTLNTHQLHQFLLVFCGKLYITDQHHAEHTSVFTYVLWEGLHYRSESLSTQINFYLCFVGSFTLQIRVTLNTDQFLLMLCGKLYITDQSHSQHRSVCTYVSWEALHYRTESLSTQISLYLCFVGSFTLQISITLNTDQFLI